MNRYSLLFGLLALPSAVSSAADCNCRPLACAPKANRCITSRSTNYVAASSCVPSSCSTSVSSSYGPTTKYFKAKDGTIREVMTHWAALHRAVEADHLDEELVATKSELEAAKTQLAELQKESATRLADMEKELLALRAQVDKQVAAVAEQKARANAEEKAKKQGQKQIANLQQRSKKAEAALLENEKKLQQTVADRDALRKANDKLQQEVASLKDAANKSAAALAESQSAVEKMKQEAIESKKTAIAKKDETPEADPAAGDDKPTEETPVEEPSKDDAEK